MSVHKTAKENKTRMVERRKTKVQKKEEAGNPNLFNEKRGIFGMEIFSYYRFPSQIPIA